MDNSKHNKIFDWIHGKGSAQSNLEALDQLCETPLSPETEQTLHDYWKTIPENGDELRSRAAFDSFCRRVGLSDSIGRRILWGRRVRNLAAALFLPVALFSLLLWLNPRQADVEWCEFAVAQGHTDSLVLPDNSRVWLNAGSHLIYPRRFNNKTRKVFLSGEAFFEVAKDAEHPFIVSADQVQVRVLGTRFNVTSYEDMNSVAVSLIEGSVSMGVAREQFKRDILLVPGDVVRYDKVSGAVEQRHQPAEAYLSWRHGDFYFNNQPLDEIAAQFERVFKVKIFIVDRSVGETPYSLAFVNGESLDQMLRAIAGNDLRIDRDKEMIIIRKKR